ncbi:MAG: hypothetical protein ACKN9K_06825, partial [Dolichospermum sp.]
LDVELDEPYTMKEKTPIHYEGLTREIDRNNHFNERGWVAGIFCILFNPVSNSSLCKHPNFGFLNAIAPFLVQGMIKLETGLNNIQNIPATQPLSLK